MQLLRISVKVKMHLLALVPFYMRLGHCAIILGRGRYVWCVMCETSCVRMGHNLSCGFLSK